VEERVIEVHDQAQVAFQLADEQGRQPTPELGHVPFPLAQEAMVRIVSVSAVRIGDVHHAGDGATARAEHPAGDQVEEQGRGRPGEQVGEAIEEAVPGDDGRFTGAGRRASGGRRGYLRGNRSPRTARIAAWRFNGWTTSAL
jgi:hypothetical protein